MSWNLADAKNWRSAWKLSYHRNLGGIAFKGDIYGTLIFRQSSMICISHHVGGQEWQPKLLFACILIVKRLIAMLRCAENNTTSFQQFPWSL